MNGCDTLGDWLDQWRRLDLLYVAYSTVAGLTLWPLFEAAVQTNQLAPVIGAVYTVAAGIGANLIANQIEAWKTRRSLLTSCSLSSGPLMQPAAIPTCATRSMSSWRNWKLFPGRKKKGGHQINQGDKTMSDLSGELAKIEEAITRLENVRGIMPDEQIEEALAPLRRQKADLEARAAREPGSSSQAEVKGSGAIAQGTGATAVGARGVNISGGGVGGSIITGQVETKGDFVGRDRTEMSGDFRGTVVNVNSRLQKVRQSVQALPQTDEAARVELAQLVEQLQTALAQAPPARQEEAEAVALAAQELVEKVQAERPNRTSLEISGEGLKKAAQNLTGIIPTVITIAGQIVDAALRYATR